MGSDKEAIARELIRLAKEGRSPVFTTKIYDRLLASDSTEIMEVGGAGSSKTRSLCQVICHYLRTIQGLQIAIGRETFPSLRMSIMRDLFAEMREQGIYDEQYHNKSNSTYDFNGNHIQFFSAGVSEQGIERIKSTNFNLIVEEEVTDFRWEEHLQLRLRLRAPKPGGWERNKLVGMCNPIDENHWVCTKLENDPGVEVNHSTYKDNPHLDDDYIKRLEALIDQDPNYYRVYVLGLWGKLDNLILRNWSEVQDLPDTYRSWAYGLDFGYSHPMALVKVVFTMDHGTYWKEIIHQSNLTNQDLIERMSHMERGDVYADSARPDQIEELKRVGWNVIAANKDVRTGLDAIKRQPLHITSDSPNLIKEVRGYCYRKDPKQGIVLEEPIKFNDDGIDAARYATIGQVERFGYATADPNANKARWKRIRIG